MIQAKLNWDEMPTLRVRCKVLSEIWGSTVFVRHTGGNNCDLVVQRSSGIRNRLLDSMRVEMVRAIVEWEIAKAEGTLRAAA